MVNIRGFSTRSKLNRHVKKALIQLDKYNRWNQLMKKSDISIEGKSVENATSMKMLSVGDVFVQRLAARAIFHEKQQDANLLALTAEKIKDYLYEEMS